MPPSWRAVSTLVASALVAALQPHGALAAQQCVRRPADSVVDQTALLQQEVDIAFAVAPDARPAAHAGETRRARFVGSSKGKPALETNASTEMLDVVGRSSCIASGIMMPNMGTPSMTGMNIMTVKVAGKDYASAETRVQGDITLSAWKLVVFGLGSVAVFYALAYGAKTWAGLSIFCFIAMKSHGKELSLVRTQLSKGAGIFACDEYVVYSDKKTWLSPGPPVEIDTVLLSHFKALKGVPGALTATYVNTDAFISAWHDIYTEGQYLKHDWVIKADPDTVIVPARLKAHVSDARFKNKMPHPLAEDKGVYLRNCPDGPRGLQLFGSLEVLSKKAVETYGGNKQTCVDQVDHAKMGEDNWMQDCMELLGVGKIGDWTLLRDGYCTAGTMGKCDVPNPVAFHPYKEPVAWLQCWDEAMGSLD